MTTPDLDDIRRAAAVGVLAAIERAGKRWGGEASGKKDAEQLARVERFLRYPPKAQEKALAYLAQMARYLELDS